MLQHATLLVRSAYNGMCRFESEVGTSGPYVHYSEVSKETKSDYHSFGGSGA